MERTGKRSDAESVHELQSGRSVGMSIKEILQVDFARQPAFERCFTCKLSFRKDGLLQRNKVGNLFGYGESEEENF